MKNDCNKRRLKNRTKKSKQNSIKVTGVYSRLMVMKTLFIFITLVSLNAFAGKSNTGTGSGRFQVVQLSDMRRDQILIDTQTGKTWSKICSISGATSADCEMEAWSPDTVIGITISEAEYYKRVRELKKYLEEQKTTAAPPQGK